MPPFFAILLRVLLSVALIFNGSGYAYAAAQMHRGGGAQDAGDTRGHAAAHETPACHTGTGDEMADASPASAVKDAAGHHDGHDGSDCCQTDQCDCVCAQHVPATGLGFWLRVPTPVRSRVPAYRLAQHVSPALSHLQRPPIG